MSTVSTIEALFTMLLAGDTSVVTVLDDAILEGASDALGVRYVCVERKAYKRGSSVFPAKRVEARYAVITPGKSIRIVGVAYPQRDLVDDQRPYDRTFALGDTVEYDSFNLSYHGPISAIGACVTVRKEYSKRTVRMELDGFTTRNHDLDLEAAAARNSDTMMAI